MPEPIRLKDRAQTAIDLGESHFREFKSGLEGPAGQKITRSIKSIRTDVAETLVAFANADGGELLVGIEDNSDVSGLNDFTDQELAAIEKAYEDRVHKETPLRSVRVARMRMTEKTILYFNVPKSHEFVHLTSDGRCLQRRDLESVPISSEKIHFDRQEIRSREYDRSFVEGPQADGLHLPLVKIVAEHISSGMTPEKCLQYLDLAEYSPFGLLLRRAALLLFAREPTRWHPRLQIRIIKVDGTTIGTGKEYNVISDELITGNILELIDRGWDALRPHLVQTRFGTGARFHATFMYPEYACREALVNAIAHRDYSQEGRGIEIFVYHDRMEVSNPGALLSTVKMEDLLRLQGVHQSRNSYVARVLRELGFMRELGEGVRRIFELMKRNELSPPELKSTNDSFGIILHHRPMYSREELLWLDHFAALDLDREQKAIVVLGRDDKVIAPQDIWDSLGLVDTEHYRRLVASLQDLGILKSEVDRRKAGYIARQRRIPARQVPRFRVVLPRERGIQAEPDLVGRVRKSKTEPLIPEPSEAAGLTGSDLTTVFVGNIDWKISADELYDKFAHFGNIESVQIPRGDRGNRGYAFVEFTSRADAERAIEQVSGTDFSGRKLHVKWAQARLLLRPRRHARSTRRRSMQTGAES